MWRSDRRNWLFGFGLTLFLVGVPYVYYRAHLADTKRIHVVDPGKIYRCGCLTGQGFEDTIRRYGIRTVLNLQEEDVDPNLATSYFRGTRERESDLCARLGVNYRYLLVDMLPAGDVPPGRPKALDAFLQLVDEPANLPILIHCKAGLHRTGILVALYRMEYQGWSVFDACQDLRSLGFGRMPSYSPNEYVRQYLSDYRPRRAGVAVPIESSSRVP